MVALDVIAMAITASRKIQGPRVTDLNGTVADYGTPLNYVYGTRRIEAACFYCEPVKEKKDTSKTKGGTYVEYLYYGTFAVIACDHKLDRFSRIWLDRHLVYDITGSGEEIQQPEDGATLNQFMRQYLGDPDQSPDPRMVAYITHKEGAGRTPAYLDISYLMFEQLPLQFLGNHFPQASVEVDGGGGPVQVFTTTPFTMTVTGSGGNGEDGNGNFRFHMIPTSYVIFSFECIAHDQFGNTDVIGADVKMLDETVPIYNFAFAPPSDTQVFQTLVGEVYVTIPRDDTRTKDGGYTVIVESERPLTIDAFDSLNGGFVNFGWAITTLGPDNPDHFLNDIPRDWDPLPTLNGAPLAGYQYFEHEFSPRGTDQIQAALTVGIFPPEEAVPITLGFICGDIIKRCGLSALDFNFNDLDQLITGYSWTIADGKQIVAPLLDLYDSDIFMHNFQLSGRKRGEEVDDGDQIETEFLIRERGSNANSASAPLYQITDESESDLPRRVFLTYADTTGGQQPNTAVSQRNVASTVTVREVPIDLTNLALDPDEAQPLAERWLRRQWMGGLSYEFITGPDEMAMECADLRTANLGEELLRGRLTRMTLRADRSIKTEWQVDGATSAGPCNCSKTLVFQLNDIPLYDDNFVRPTNSEGNFYFDFIMDVPGLDGGAYMFIAAATQILPNTTPYPGVGIDETISVNYGDVGGVPDGPDPALPVFDWSYSSSTKQITICLRYPLIPGSDINFYLAGLDSSVPGTSPIDYTAAMGEGCNDSGSELAVQSDSGRYNFDIFDDYPAPNTQYLGVERDKTFVAP